ncbi:DUF3943 domain-containing protein [Persicimonas caeni]|uniref:DUF3943 domain-containing protein n=1 Tax=Persicimonas caeni TaxID=2292766 RepID=A0A4Y6PXK0_PERCE|nr:DUF3943 domain-containing protein [Persicimonas caeni]QDG53046.1 DUF3943 domain-containing protein [Persicimonas caeni]QED34268.1 DUF3943 domain-containing protein [Persicimonas caeni]
MKSRAVTSIARSKIIRRSRVLCGLVCCVMLLALAAPARALGPAESADEPRGWDYLIPVGSMLGANVAFWATARYLLEEDYAFIGLDSVASNFEEGFEWDADAFPTNQIGHPYQGGLYHTGARAVGFGFWGSVPYTALGSLHWELFMETQNPSYNDFITTTIGGVALGEVLFRLSSALLDDSSWGWERVGREGGATALTPIWGIGRLVSGEAFHRGEAPGEFPVRTRLALGLDEFRPADVADVTDGGIPSLGLDARVVYGSFVDDGEPFEPFDWFELGVGVNYSHKDFYAAQLDITGLLARWGFGCGEDNQCAWGPMMHYDYYDSPLFKVGTSSVGASALGSFELGWWSLRLFAQFDLGAIALGGFDSPYAEVVERDYNLGAGGLARTILVLTKPGWFQLRSISSRYYVRTLHGSDGHEMAGITRQELEIPITRSFALSAGSVLYDRVGVPDNHDPITSSHVAGQFQFVWRLQ